MDVDDQLDADVPRLGPKGQLAERAPAHQDPKMPGKSSISRVDPGDPSRQQHLDWQFDFLRTSIERYEAGNEHEALRIAGTIRILCYDQRSSVSLLGQLGLLDAWVWIDTARSSEAMHRVMNWGPLVIENPSVNKIAQGPRLAAPLAAAGRSADVTFDQWWDDVVLTANPGEASRAPRGGEYSRRLLVTVVANQDGGAHVDPKIDAEYHRLSRELSMGLPGRTADVNRVVATPAWEFMRQVGYEIEATAHRADPARFRPPILRAPPQNPTSWLSSVWGGSG